jgi:hypothetical protein
MADIVERPVHIVLAHDPKRAAARGHEILIVNHYADHPNQLFDILPDGKIRVHGGSGKFTAPGGKHHSLVRVVEPHEAYEWVIQKTPKGIHIGTKEGNVWTFTTLEEPILIAPQNVQTEKLQTLEFVRWEGGPL